MDTGGNQGRRLRTVYDFDELQAQIRSAKKMDPGAFYRQDSRGPRYCQGDILSLEMRLPYINDQLQIKAIREPFQYWVVASNTCAMSRTGADIKLAYINLHPLHRVEEPSEAEMLSGYGSYHEFYLPVWSSDAEVAGWFINFSEVACLQLEGLLVRDVPVVNRLSDPAWALFHACSVRFWARDDGRHD